MKSLPTRFRALKHYNQHMNKRGVKSQDIRSDLSLKKNVFFENPKSKFLFCFVMNKNIFRFVKKDLFTQLHPICHPPKYTHIAKYSKKSVVHKRWWLLGAWD